MSIAIPTQVPYWTAKADSHILEPMTSLFPLKVPGNKNDRPNFHRLLDNREEYLKLYKHLFTFSSGPRSCIGRELAIASKSFCTLAPGGEETLKRFPVIKIVLVAVYMEFSTTVVPEAEKLWKNGDEAHKTEVCFERADW